MLPELLLLAEECERGIIDKDLISLIVRVIYADKVVGGGCVDGDLLVARML